MARKWEIEGLNNHKEFCDSAKIILSERINHLTYTIRKFFETESIENLHQVRIALRRVRYNMELFISCFDKKKFLIFYKQVEFLQDFSGKIRDLDVLTQNLNLLKEKNIRISKNIYRTIGEERNTFNGNLKLELMKFIHSKSLSNFQKLLS
ncbi:MAG: CHAD domain-containing protein [Ignavibacteriales bacterium]|nr:MAG: CHAD domain-containing protein [Ignavibacteriales bacterium]